MIAACAGFATMSALIRHISAELHAFEIAFFRNFFGLVVLLPWLMRSGFGVLRTKRLGLYALRGLFGLLAMMCWFWAITVMPLAEAVALSFTVPIFATVLAVLILGEAVHARRWTAMAVGFAGAMIILRPGVEEVGLPQLAVIVAAVFMASAVIAVKMLSRTETTTAIVAYMGIFLAPVSLVPALFVWRTPGWETLLWLVGLGATASFAHACLTRSFAAADASAVMPYDFSRLIFVSVIAYFAFGEVADLWTWVGATIIVGAAVYIARRDQLQARSAHAAAEASADRADR